MTARQQLARLLPLVLLVVLVIAGLRGVVPAARWNGPLKADGVAIGMQLLASGELRLRSQQALTVSQAAEAHRLVEQGHAHHKLLLTTNAELAEVAK